MSVVVLVIVVAVVGTAAILLARTVDEAQSINDKAQNIAKTGRGINTATDSVVQLTRTNALATSILKSAKPLENQLGGIVNTAQGIDGLAVSINDTAVAVNDTAGSINNTAGAINNSAGDINGAAGEINQSAGSINSSAGRINASAGSINNSAGAINRSAGTINNSAGSINKSARTIDTTAASILDTAKKVDTDVRLINQNLDVTLSLVTAVKGDTGNILGQAGGANDTAACISRKLFGSTSDDGDCKGQSTPASTRRAHAKAPAPLRSPKELRKLVPDEAPRSAEPTPKAAPQPAPTDTQPTSPLPKLPTPLLDDIIKGLPKLPNSLGLGQSPNNGGPPGNLLNQLLPGLGQR